VRVRDGARGQLFLCYTHDMSPRSLPETSLPQEVRVNVPLLGREARVVVTFAAPVKPTPLEGSPTPKGDKLIADLVIENRR
jgi:hypothetical protein